ncbi:MAG: hypothetical protein RL621_331 [Bacteroidota bacterium]|jgi:hypothetical protein
MDKMKLAQKIIDLLMDSDSMDEFEIASITALPVLEENGSISFDMNRIVNGGFRKPGPLVQEICKVNLVFERHTFNNDTGEETLETF